GLIENNNFTSPLLAEKKELINTGATKASRLSKKFSKAIDSLEQRNNFLIRFLLNGFMLWDIRQSYKLERWIVQNHQHLQHWVKITEFIDAYNCGGNVASTHPDYVYPDITWKTHIINARDLSRPLLDPRKRIDNRLVIDNERYFIMRGANMAGK